MSTINEILIDRITKKFKERFCTWPTGIARAPGRVNLLGEHVDYNDGFVMPAATDRATYVAFSESRDENSKLAASDFNEEISFTPDSIKGKKQSDSTPLPDWGLYPAGVGKTLRDDGYPIPPINAIFASDVPRGAGLSSSASVEVAFLTAWQSLGNLDIPEMKRALICQQAENRYVGVDCGIMDQFASVCGVQDRLLHLDCRSLEWSMLELPKNVSIVIADTTIRRKLSRSEYNQRRQDCEEAVRVLKTDLPTIRSLRDVGLDDFEKVCWKLPPRVEKRARHVIEEIDRTVRARDLLVSGDIAGFGKLVNACHASLRDLYEVSSFELDVMVYAAQSMDGCYGARLTGAGFGGCTVNLVENGMVKSFIARLKRIYLEKTARSPEIYISRASMGAGLVMPTG
jgi:galactokinase